MVSLAPDRLYLSVTRNGLTASIKAMLCYNQKSLVSPSFHLRIAKDCVSLFPVRILYKFYFFMFGLNVFKQRTVGFLFFFILKFVIIIGNGGEQK